MMREARGQGLVGYAPAYCGRLCESVPCPTLAVRCLFVTKDGSPTRRSSLVLGFHATHQACAASYGRGRFGLVVAALTWPASGRKPVQPSRVGHVSMRERSACTSLSCRESWRWRGCALGFMAATLQRQQFPLRCAHSSRAKL